MKRITRIWAALFVALALIAIEPSFAHTAICNCYDNGDDTITCEGGFSDGGSVEGVSIRILNLRERVLIDGKLDASSSFSFDRPEEEFHVVLDAGEGHTVTVYAEDIE